MTLYRYIEIFRSSLTEVGSAVVFSGGRRFGGGGSGMGMGYGRPSPYDRGGDRFGGGNNGGRFQPRSSRNFKGGYSSNGSPGIRYQHKLFLITNIVVYLQIRVMGLLEAAVDGEAATETGAWTEAAVEAGTLSV